MARSGKRQISAYVAAAVMSFVAVPDTLAECSCVLVRQRGSRIVRAMVSAWLIVVCVARSPVMTLIW